MMLALIGFNANAAMYIVGNNPFGDWHTYAGVEMTDNGNGVYTYVTDQIGSTVWFVFADGLTTGTSDDWNTFNSNYRYGPLTSGEAIQPGVEYTTQKSTNGSVSYSFAGALGQSYQFTFDTNTMKFKVEGYVPEPEFNSFTVVGNNEDIFGTTWNPANDDNDMTLDETDGLYKLVRNDIAIPAAYTLEYKVVANHDPNYAYNWGKTPNGENQDYYFEESGTYNLTFKFDLENQTVSLDAEKVQDGPVVDDYYIVAGTENLFGSNWSNTDTLNLMTEIDGGMFIWTKEGFEATAGTEVEFKVVANGNWNTCWPPSDEESDHNWYYQFGEDGVYAVTITFNEDTKEINLTAVRTGDLPEPPQPTVDPVYIIGNVTEYNWDAIHGVEMTYDETNEVYTAEINVTDANNGLGYFGFTKKLADPESETDVWTQIADYRFGPMCEGEGDWVMTEELLNQNCELNMEGSNSIEIPAGAWTVTVDLKNNLFKINGEWPTDTVVPETPNVYLFGDVNNYAWDPTQGVMMDYAEGIYTGVVTATPREGAQVAYIGFTKKLASPDSDVDPWTQINDFRFGPMGEGENWQMTEDLLGVACALATDGSYLSVAIPAGEWTFSINLENNTFTINGEWPDTPGPEPYDGDVYILGEVNDNGGWFPNIGSQMTRDAENNVYTATITTAGENDGYSYFSFTKKIAENTWENGGWDEIAGYRFGAETNDFEVTEEVLGQELTLVNYENAYKIPAGKWNLTLSVDDMTLVITKAAGYERGDVNMDGEIDINDVTRLIDVVLGKNVEYDPAAANCNVEGGDAGIDINDVTALISRVLTGSWAN